MKPPREVAEGFPFRVRIKKRPTCPSLVNRTGTAVNDTLDEQIRVELDQPFESKWGRTILVLPEDIQKIDLEGRPIL